MVVWIRVTGLQQSDNGGAGFCHGRTALDRGRVIAVLMARETLVSREPVPKVPSWHAYQRSSRPYATAAMNHNGDDEEHHPDPVEVKHTATAPFRRGSCPCRMSAPARSSSPVSVIAPQYPALTCVR